MTLILACASPEGLILGCDLVTVAGHRVDMLQTKWTKFGPWHIGCSGDAACGQAVEFGNDEPPPADITGLIAYFRRLFLMHGCDPNKENTHHYEVSMVVAKDKEVWSIDGSLYALPMPQGQWAVCGSGSEVAIGALEAFYEADVPFAPSEIARLVLQIAERRNAYVRGCKVDVIPYGQPPAAVTRLPRRGGEMLVQER